MVRKKKQDIAITVAVIGAIGAIIAGYYQGPLADTQWKNRPIVDVSLGGIGTSLPSQELQHDGNNYFVDILMRNRGHSDGKVTVTVQGTNAKIWSSYYKTWEYSQSALFVILSNDSATTSKIYVLPDGNSNSFSTELSVADPTDKPPFQELTILRPTKLTYEKSDETYKLIDQR